MGETLGMRLIALRKTHNLTQENVAEHLGVSPQAVSKWENDSSCPDVMLLPQIAKLYHTTVDALLGNEPEIQVLPAEKRKKMEDMILHILVNDADGDRVRVNLPLILVKTALEIGLSVPEISGGNDILQKIDLEKVLLLVDQGLIGKLVEVQSADGSVVDIVVD